MLGLKLDHVSKGATGGYEAVRVTALHSVTMISAEYLPHSDNNASIH